MRVMPLEPHKTESIVGFIILLVLIAIAAGVFHRQFQYDPAVFTAASPRGTIVGNESVADGAKPDLSRYVPKEMHPVGEIETFGADSLSDKIDGKAELYLSAGFLSLNSQRFSKGQTPDLWLEVFVYDMGSMRSAFSVFSSQRRENAAEIELTRFAYRTSNAVFFVHGQEYVEIIAASDALGDDMLSIGKEFIESKPVSNEGLNEIALFPPGDLDSTSVSLHSANAFGFDRLDNTFTARYAIRGEDFTAFMSLRNSPAGASELAEAYCRFLVENGGSEISKAVDIPGAKLIQIFDTYEVVFTYGSILAGIHEAEDANAAMELAGTLFNQLQMRDK